MWLYPVPIGIGPGRGGGACNRELPRILLPRTRMNKGKNKKGRGCYAPAFGCLPCNGYLLLEIIGAPGSPP
jgi:hypothetical protein